MLAVALALPGGEATETWNVTNAPPTTGATWAREPPLATLAANPLTDGSVTF
jgi:hypothetical protein